MNVGNNRVVGVKFLITGEYYCIKCAIKYFQHWPTEGALIAELSRLGRAEYWALIRQHEHYSQQCCQCKKEA